MAWLGRLVQGGVLASFACIVGPRAGGMPAAVTPTFVQQAQARWPSVSRESLERGRALFVSRCSKCHDLPDRLAYDEDRWPGLVDKMALEAKLDADQERLVLQFILAERASAVAPITASPSRETNRSRPAPPARAD